MKQLMKDYWKDLSLREAWSKRERFNFILNYFDEKLESSNGETNDEPVDEPTVEPVEPVTVNVSVHVKDSEDNGINGALVEIYQDNNDPYTGNTGKAGGCTVRNVPVGEYSIRTSAEGYITSIDDLTVVDGDNSIEIVLELENETVENGGD